MQKTLLRTIAVLLFVGISTYGSYKEVFIGDYNDLGFNKTTLSKISEVNEYLAQELTKCFSGKRARDPSNFSSVCIWYRIKGEQDLNCFPLTSDTGTGEKIIYASGIDNRKDFLKTRHFVNLVNDQQKLLDTYLKRGNVFIDTNDDYCIDEYNEKDEQFESVKLNKSEITYKNELESFLMNHKITCHTEQSSLNHILFSIKNYLTNKSEEVDFVLLNIISRYPACPDCFTALEKLLTNKKEQHFVQEKKQFVYKDFDTSLKEDILNELFPNWRKNLNIHILDRYLINSPHRREERTQATRFNKTDLFKSKDSYFINMASEEEKIDQKEMIDEVNSIINK